MVNIKLKIQDANVLEQSISRDHDMLVERFKQIGPEWEELITINLQKRKLVLHMANRRAEEELRSALYTGKSRLPPPFNAPEANVYFDQYLVICPRYYLIARNFPNPLQFKSYLMSKKNVRIHDVRWRTNMQREVIISLESCEDAVKLCLRREPKDFVYVEGIQVEMR